MYPKLQTRNLHKGPSKRLKLLDGVLLCLACSVGSLGGVTVATLKALIRILMYTFMYTNFSYDSICDVHNLMHLKSL